MSRNKYSHDINMGGAAVESLGIDSQFKEMATKLLGASGAYNSIRVHKAAMNKIKSVEEKYGVSLDLPWTTKSLVNFGLCCASDCLKASTVRNYVSQVKRGHVMMNLPWNPDTALFNSLMKGLENSSDPGARRIAVTPRMLLAFRRKIKSLKKSWSRHDRRAMWALIAFLWCGSFRSAELLAPTASGFLEEETFTWGRLGDNKAKLEGVKTRWYSVLLRKPKEFRAGKEGVKIELFDVPAAWNPVQAMDKFREDNVLGEEPGLPVFRWSSGQNITRNFLNGWIKSCGISMDGYPGNSTLSSHCFRAGIVTMMGAMGCEENLIKSVGRWAGNSWLRYAKTGRSIRKSDQWKIQQQAANEFQDWSPIPVLVESQEE